MLSILSCVCWQSVDLLWRNIYLGTMEYYSAIKRNEIELFVVRWMDLETVIQSEDIWNLKKKKKGSEEPQGRTGIKMQM